MPTRSTSSRASSSAWSWSDGPARGAAGTTTRVRSRTVPLESLSVKALVYLTGRNPRKVKGVKVYETTCNDNASDDAMSDWSAGSGYSWPWGGDHQKLVEVYLVESRGYYYGDDDDDDSWVAARKTKNKKKKPAAAAAGGKAKKGGGGRRQSSASASSASSESSYDSASSSAGDDSDGDGEDGGSMRDYGRPGQPPPHLYAGFPAPGMGGGGMPRPMMGGQGGARGFPPGGAMGFPPGMPPPPMPGGGPRPGSGFRPPGTGMPMGMPPPPMPGAGRPPGQGPVAGRAPGF